MTESPLLQVSCKMNDARKELVMSVGSLSLPLLKVNIADILGDLTTQFACSMEQLEGRTVTIFPGPYMKEIGQMIESLYPVCAYNSSSVRDGGPINV